MTNWTAAELEKLRLLLPKALVTALQQPTPDTKAWITAGDRLQAQLNAYLPFVPAPIQDGLLRDPALGRLPPQRPNGTLLCADVSGFTALSSELATAGRQGSEAISALMNRLFAALLAEVAAHGGGVIQFGGDALTALFDSATLGPTHAAQAAAAALAMQTRMSDFAAVPTERGLFPLRLRIALHSGELFAVVVGDSEHSELVVTGSAIHRVVVAQEQAAPGAVVLSAETRQALPDADVVPIAAGLYELQRVPTPPRPPTVSTIRQAGPPGPAAVTTLLARIAAVEPFVPLALPKRFARLHAEGGEFRPVTVLFSDFYTFPDLAARLAGADAVDPAVLGAVLNHYYTAIQRVVHSFGGTINKVDMAASGNRVLALFGAPVAHEDDPNRATEVVLALPALLMEADRAVADLPAGRPGAPAPPEFQPRIGIAAGTVFAGILGTPARHEYTVMGRTVNLAARLLAAAGPTDVLLTAAVYRTVNRRLQAEPLPPLLTKGMPEPVPVFRAQHARAAAPNARHWVPIIGRSTELEQVIGVGTRALTAGPQAGGVAALAGEAGIGKSRLAAEAVRLLRMNRAVRVVSETCRSYEETAPYSVFGRILCQLLPPTTPAALQVLLDDLLPAWSRFAPLLHPLLGLPPAETTLTTALSAEGRRDRLTDLVRALVPALADRRPLVLLLDDLQWADASSRALIDTLVGELGGRPLLLLLVGRTLADLPPVPPDLTNGLTLTLPPLTAGDSTALLQTLLGGGEVPGELDSLVDHSAGMPFFLEETVRYLLDSGALRRSPDGHWLYLRPISQESVPARVEQMITARLDRLDEETRLLAQVAAVFGPQVSTRLLASVPAAATHLHEKLACLAEAALLVPSEEGDGTEYRFKQGVTRDVTYSSLLFARRRELHAQAAAAIEHIYADDLAGQHAVLAEHYRRAEQPTVAFAHFIAAATQAQADYAHAEALLLYPQALAVAPWTVDPTQPPDLKPATPLYEGWGDLLALTGNYPAARDQYTALLHLVQRKTDLTQAVHAAALHRKLGSTYEHQGNMEQARTGLQIAAAALATLPATAEVILEQARVLSDLGWVGFRQGDLDQAQLYLDQALNTVLPLADQPAAAAQQAAVLNRLGGVAWSRGDLARAQSYVEQYLHNSEQSGNLADQAKALNNLALLLERQDRLMESIRCNLQALDINEQIGNRRMLAVGTLNAGYTFYCIEDYASARHYLNQSIKWAGEVHDNHYQQVAYLNLGRVYTAMGEWDLAAEALQESLARTQQLQNASEELDVRVALGELALQRGDPAGAATAYQAGAALATDMTSEEYGRFQRLEARIAETEGHRTKAVELLVLNEALFVQLQNAVEIRRTRSLRRELSMIADSH